MAQKMSFESNLDKYMKERVWRAESEIRRAAKFGYFSGKKESENEIKNLKTHLANVVELKNDFKKSGKDLCALIEGTDCPMDRSCDD